MTTPQIFGGDKPEQSEQKGMDRDELQSILRAEIDDAIDYVENTLGARRAEATSRYKGEPYGDEEPGRSSIVSRDLRDTVMQILPSLVRIFCGPKQVVEYEPDRLDMVSAAKQRTDYANLVFMRDNPGFHLLYTGFKDALVRSHAIYKWWWEDKTEVTNETYEGLLQEQVVTLGDDDSISDIAVEEMEEIDVPAEEGAIQPDPLMPGQAPPGPQKAMTYRVRVRREKAANRICVRLIPGEEVLIDRRATNETDATILGHRRGVTRSDLVAMGYDPDTIDEHEGQGDFTYDYSPEALSRSREHTIPGDTTPNPDLAQTLYTEVWVEFDNDGDGIAELHKVCCLGGNYFIMKIEDAVDRPFGILCPDPEPHEFGGLGYFDILEDIQRINTLITRASLDSLSLAIVPRMEVVEGQANIADVLNTENGGVIRVKAPNMVRSFEQPFVGDAGLRMLEYFRTIKEERGGVTRTSQGLDADALQSTTKAAVSAQVSAAQARIELIARVFAETGIKRMFEGIQRLLMRHQDVERTVRLRNEWVTMDPRTWNAPLDVIVNVGLGVGAPEDRMVRLATIAEKQEIIIQQLGPSNPLVSVAKYRNTLAKIVELSGEGDPDAFFGDVPEGWAPEPPPTPPDPAMVIAQAQAKKLELDSQIAMQRLELDKMKMQHEMQQAELEARTKLEVEILKIEAQNGVDLNDLEIFERVERDKNRMNAQAKVESARLAAEAKANQPKPGAGSA